MKQLAAALAIVIAATSSQTALAQVDSPDIGLLTIEIVEVGVDGRSWGGVSSAFICDEIERVDEGSTLTIRQECPFSRGQPFLAIEIFAGFEVSAGCGDDDLAAVLSETVPFALDDDGNAECRVRVVAAERLDVTVATDSRMPPVGDLIATLETAAGGLLTVNRDRECVGVDIGPVEEVPEVLLGLHYQCTLAAGPYTLTVDPIVPGVDITAQCGLGDPGRLEPVPLGAAGTQILVGPDDVDECLVFFRGVDGLLVTSIASTNDTFDPTDWTIEITRGGDEVNFVLPREAGGECTADGTCSSDPVRFGEYEVTLTGPSGIVTSTVENGLTSLLETRTVSVTVQPGQTSDVDFVVGTELPATGHNAWIAILAALFIAVGLVLVRSTRRLPV